MKTTKIMITGLCTFLITWCILGLIGYLLSDNVSYKECMRDGATILVTTLIGWVPALIVCNDLYDKLND